MKKGDGTEGGSLKSQWNSHLSARVPGDNKSNVQKNNAGDRQMKLMDIEEQ